MVIERPKNPEHGDYSTNVALRLAKPAGKPAREVAAAIAARLRVTDGITRVDVAGPGFLNITLAAHALGQVVRTIVGTGASFGRGDALAGQNLNLEFVSANINSTPSRRNVSACSSSGSARTPGFCARTAAAISSM